MGKNTAKELFFPVPFVMEWIVTNVMDISRSFTYVNAGRGLPLPNGIVLIIMLSKDER
jgi:hypothetical protein